MTQEPITKNQERDSETLIRVEGVSKKFARSLKRGMVYGLQDIAKAALIPQRHRSEHLPARLSDAMNQERITGNQELITNNQQPATNNKEQRTKNKEPDALRPSEFWALRDVSFTIKRGECLGIIGSNGAGKTTLFSILSGIYGPTSGRVETRGRLQALIALGAGFHPLLSGRENVYVNASIFGLTGREIDAKLDQILEFADIGEFIDMPVKNYSSGMMVRLGFSVAAHLDPDVLLVDEVLAVGDLDFQHKSIAKMNEFLAGNCAVALIAHSLYRIESLSSHCMWLDHGTVKAFGDTSDVVKQYRDHQAEKDRLNRAANIKKKGVGGGYPVLIEGVELLDEAGVPTDSVPYGRALRFRIRYHADRKIEYPRFDLTIVLNGHSLFAATMLIDGNSPERIDGAGMIECHFPDPGLLPKTYDVRMFIRTQEGTVDVAEMKTYVSFTVTSEGLEVIQASGPYALGHLMQGAPLHRPYEWSWS